MADDKQFSKVLYAPDGTKITVMNEERYNALKGTLGYTATAPKQTPAK